jgi:hypothetical protein
VQVGDPTIARLGSINTVRLNGEGWPATNTDYTGFLRAYRERFGATGPGDVMVMGAGGVGSSVAYGLAVLGATRIRIHDVQQQTATALARDVSAQTGVPVEAIPAEAVQDAVNGTTGLVNCTPLGMHHHPGNPFSMATLKKQRWAFDAIFLEPASDKGRSTLRLGDNMWLYIPNVGKPVRITSLQSVIGGVFNNADILRVDYSVEYDASIEQEEKESLVLSLKAKNAEVAYDRLKMWVDRKLLLPTKIEAYAASGLLIKTLHFKQIKDFGAGIRRPAVVETDSPLYKGYVSVMLYSGIKPRSVADEAFTLNNMHRVEELRK